jgi:hypothetical protein
MASPEFPGAVDSVTAAAEPRRSAVKDKGEGTMMKRILKALLFVVAGCIIGFVLGSLNSYRAISSFTSSALTEMAVDVYDLQEGRSEWVLERKRRALPLIVQQLESRHRKFLSEGQWNSALWAVERCYEDQESGPPASIKRLLDALPPRPLPDCEIRRRASEERGTEEDDSIVEPDAPADADKPRH